jgi:hypothetical protein
MICKLCGKVNDDDNSVGSFDKWWHKGGGEMGDDLKDLFGCRMGIHSWVENEEKKFCKNCNSNYIRISSSKLEYFAECSPLPNN